MRGQSLGGDGDNLLCVLALAPPRGDEPVYMLAERSRAMRRQGAPSREHLLLKFFQVGLRGHPHVVGGIGIG